LKALVVYESFWGNTAAVARAIAEGIGDARAVTTDEATDELVAVAEVIVAGAPLLGFSLPREEMRRTLPETERRAPNPPDTSHPSMRTWLEHLGGLQGGPRQAGAAFETRISWSPGSAAKSIEQALTGAGYEMVASPGKFVVTGKYGPLKDGELARARRWGEEIAARMAASR